MPTYKYLYKWSYKWSVFPRIDLLFRTVFPSGSFAWTFAPRLEAYYPSIFVRMHNHTVAMCGITTFYRNRRATDWLAFHAAASINAVRSCWSGVLIHASPPPSRRYLSSIWTSSDRDTWINVSGFVAVIKIMKGRWLRYNTDTGLYPDTGCGGALTIEYGSKPMRRCDGSRPFPQNGKIIYYYEEEDTKM